MPPNFPLNTGKSCRLYMILIQRAGATPLAKPQTISGSPTSRIVFRFSCGTLSACCRRIRWPR